MLLGGGIVKGGSVLEVKLGMCFKESYELLKYFWGKMLVRCGRR